MRKRALSIALFLSSLALLVHTAHAQTPFPSHIQRARGVKRLQALRVPPSVFAGDSGYAAPRTIQLRLFSDTPVVLTLDHAEQTPSHTAWSGRVEGIDRSSATFVISGNRVTGSINLGDGRVYQIRTEEDGTQWAVEIDQSLFPRDEGDAGPAAPLNPKRTVASVSNDAAAPADDGSTIDVLVLYTPSARIAAGGPTSIQQLVQLGVAETNTAYLNSGVIQRIRLVDAEEINYQESSNGIAADLNQISSLGTVAALRDKYGADLVSLWVSTGENICGTGYELPEIASSPATLSTLGFSVVELNCATGYYTFGHEMGHNMGAHHAKDDLLSNGAAPVGAFSYSNGYKQTSGTDRFRTVMAYDCNPTCPRIQYFSNPAVTYHSLPVGVDPNSSQGADNVLALNNTRNVVANFRASVVGLNGSAATPLLTITTQTQTVTSASFTVTGTATDSGSGDNGISSVTVNGVRANNDTASGAGTANWSRDVTLSPGANVITVVATDNSASKGSSSATVTITLLTTSLITSATAGSYHVFPQFADGRLSDGSFFKTTVMISNPSSTAAADCALQLHGATLPGFGLNYSMPASGWVIASTDGQGAYQFGYAALQCTAAVEAQLLYSFYGSDGTKISEATVFSSPAAASVQTIADERDGARLGLAIANDSDQTVTYTVSVTNAAGTGSVTLGPRSSTAKYIGELVPGVPPNNLGQVVVSAANGKASIIGLRFTGGVFTTIPQSIAGSTGATSNTYHVFPQFADGKFTDGSYFRTTRIYSDPSRTAVASCTTVLRGMTTNSGNIFTGTVAPGGAIVAPTSGTQSLQSGYASMQCTSSVDAEALYSFYAANGVKLSEATVFSSPPGRIVQILSDSREGAQVGLALANDTDQANMYAITVYDANGAVVGTATQMLPARSSIARFVKEFVPLPPNHFGPVVVSGTAPLSVIGLRFTGSTFTTIPETIRLSDAPTNITPVVVTRAYTMDTNSVPTTSFSAGQTVRLVMDRISNLSSQVTVEAHYTAVGPSGYVLANLLVAGSTATPGPHSRYIDVSIPADAPAGTYTFQALVLYNGVSSSQSSTFTIAPASGTETGTVTVVRAWTADTNNLEKTNFSPGQSLHLMMDRMSTLSTQVNVEARYKATGPGSYLLADSDIAASPTLPGLQTRFIEVAIPANAPAGTYTFEATVIYNAASSVQTTTFTVSTSP